MENPVFGIAVAVLIALVSPAFTPWTVPWWWCISIAFIVVIIVGAKVDRRNAPAYVPILILIAAALIVMTLHATFRQDSIAQ
jgi:hypothetical protein